MAQKESKKRGRRAARYGSKAGEKVEKALHELKNEGHPSGAGGPRVFQDPVLDRLDFADDYRSV